MGASNTADFLVIGAGIVGVTLALELAARFPGASITLIEKEPELGLHASGRNSGVLHAGFYYTRDSLKARFTRDGNRRLTQYCLERGLTINQCGKLVVARNAGELAGLDELLRRGARNGVEVHDVSAAEAREIEPLARTHERALWSPSTSSVNPREVLVSLAADARKLGVGIRTGTSFLGRKHDDIMTSQGRWSAGMTINAAGLYADRIARDFGFAEHSRILPFKGLYLHGTEGFHLQRHVYPVPDLANPFLGVHFTVTADKHAKIGPTAIPAFWREQYGGFARFNAREFGEIVWREAQLFMRNDFDFRRLALREARKYRRRHLVRLASDLVPSARPALFPTWGQPGIRAQLFDTRSRTLQMDFVHEGDAKSFHVLNAVSPAFTCALPFSEYLGGEIARLVG